MLLTENDVKRFKEKFREGSEDECWEWSGRRSKKGYGEFDIRSFAVKRKTFSAPKLSWELYNTSEVPKGMMVCHHCDNPSCVNPSHLYVGTGYDNNSDTIIRGRGNRVIGSKCSWATLTEKDVLEIRASREKQLVLAKRYGVSQSHISRIKSGDRNLWSSVKA